MLSWIIKGLGKCYQPLLSADNAFLDFDCSEFHKKPNLIIVYYEDAKEIENYDLNIFLCVHTRTIK